MTGGPVVFCGWKTRAAEARLESVTDQAAYVLEKAKTCWFVRASVEGEKRRLVRYEGVRRGRQSAADADGGQIRILQEDG